jgi:hypothetical protein
MANTFKALARTSASTSLVTLYTVPSTTTTLVNNILVANTSSASQTYTILFNNLAIAQQVQIPSRDTAVLDIRQVLQATNTIRALASSSVINFHISGLEIT